MTSQLEAVLEIAGVGSVLLFIALAGLVGLMYLLTASWPFGGPPTPEADAEAEAEAEARALAEREAQEAREEQDRQLRAVALAVALGCAETERSTATAPVTSSAWQSLHRARRLVQRPSRARTRV